MLNPLNPLSKHLLDGTLEKTERLTEALPKLPLDEGTALRLRRRDLLLARCAIYKRLWQANEESDVWQIEGSDEP